MKLDKLYEKDKDILFKELFDFLLAKPEFCTDLFRAIRIIKTINDNEGYKPVVTLWRDKKAQLEKVGEREIKFLQKISISNVITDEDTEYIANILLKVGWTFIK